MKKRMISCFLALCLMLSFMPAAAAEVASGTCGKDLTYTTDDEGNMIVRGNLNWSLDDAGTLTITGTGAMEDYTNTSMPGWEEYKSSIKAVRIQNGVTRIGSWAFENCTNLTSLTIPDSVTSIGYLAFYLCRSLPSIEIPNTVSSIEYRAFDCCSALASVNIPTSMTKLENSVFASCESLTNMVIPENITSIGEYVFSSCSNLKSIVIPDSVTSLGRGAFSSCSSLESIIIPEGVTSIGDWTFSSCTSLTELVIPSKVTSIDMYAVWGCTSLRSVTIPAGITKIPDVFGNCDNITDVYYSGTMTQWKEIPLGVSDAPLLAATIHCTDGDIILAGADTGTYEITSPLGVLDEQNHHYTISGEQPWSFTVAAPEGDFAALYIDGTEVGGNSLPGGSMKYVGVAVDRQDDGMVTFTMLRLNMIGSGTHTIAVEFRKADQPGWVRRASQNFDVRLEETAALPQGVRYVPYSESILGEASAQADADNIRYELKGSAPSGLSLSPDGTLSGVPMAAGTWKFSVLYLPASSDAENGSWTASEKPFELTILSNTDAAVKEPNDYTIIEPIGRPSGSDPNHFYKTEYSDERFVIDGPYSDFYRLRIDGVELEEPEDYTSEEGSTVITIRSQTFRRFGEGTHTISAEYRENQDPKSPLKQVAQNYTLTIDRPSSGGSSGSGSSSGGGSSDDDRRPSTTPNSTKPKPRPQKPEAKPTLPFTDVSPLDWFYEDLKWAYENGIMLGVSDTEFAPQRRVSQATIVTVLARLAQVDLTRFDGEEEPGITAGQSYTAAAVWAKRSGLLPEEGAFTGDETTTRNQMAVMLVKYLQSMGKDTTPSAQPAVFADAGDMTQEGNDAFRVLYQQSIFKGVGGLNMNAAGSTTRAHFVALIHRIYEAAMTEA